MMNFPHWEQHVAVKVYPVLSLLCQVSVLSSIGVDKLVLCLLSAQNVKNRDSNKADVRISGFLFLLTGLAKCLPLKADACLISASWIICTCVKHSLEIALVFTSGAAEEFLRNLLKWCKCWRLCGRCFCQLCGVALDFVMSLSLSLRLILIWFCEPKLVCVKYFKDERIND